MSFEPLGPWDPSMIATLHKTDSLFPGYVLRWRGRITFHLESDPPFQCVTVTDALLRIRDRYNVLECVWRLGGEG